MKKEAVTRFIEWLIEKGAIKKDDFSLYYFALESFILSVIPFIISFCFGIFLCIPFESLLNSIVFLLIRKFAGGYHLRNSTLCVILSSILLCVCDILIFFDLKANYVFIFSCFSFLIIWIFSPIENENKKLSVEETRQYKRICRILSTIIMLLIIAFQIVGWNKITLSFETAIILVAVTQIPDVFFNVK